MQQGIKKSFAYLFKQFLQCDCHQVQTILLMLLLHHGRNLTPAAYGKGVNIRTSNFLQAFSLHLNGAHKKKASDLTSKPDDGSRKTLFCFCFQSNFCSFSLLLYCTIQLNGDVLCLQHTAGSLCLQMFYAVFSFCGILGWCA